MEVILQAGEIFGSKHVQGVIFIVDKHSSIFYIGGTRAVKIYKIKCAFMLILDKKERYHNHGGVLSIDAQLYP